MFGEGPEEIDSYLPAAFYKILSDKGRRGLAEFVVNVSFFCKFISCKGFSFTELEAMREKPLKSWSKVQQHCVTLVSLLREWKLK